MLARRACCGYSRSMLCWQGLHVCYAGTAVHAMLTRGARYASYAGRGGTCCCSRSFTVTPQLAQQNSPGPAQHSMHALPALQAQPRTTQQTDATRTHCTSPSSRLGASYMSLQEHGPPGSQCLPQHGLQQALKPRGFICSCSDHLGSQDLTLPRSRD